jgi:hypothetical protein
MEYKANCIHSINSRLEWRIINYNCKDVQSTSYKVQVQENLTIGPIFRVCKKPSPSFLPIWNKFLWLPTVTALVPIQSFPRKRRGGEDRLDARSLFVCWCNQQVDSLGFLFSHATQVSRKNMVMSKLFLRSGSEDAEYTKIGQMMSGFSFA